MKASKLITNLEKALKNLKKMDGDMEIEYFGLDGDDYTDPQPLKSFDITFLRSDEEHSSVDVILKVSYKDY